MHILGFDVAKESIDIAAITRTGKVKTLWQVENTSEALTDFLSTVVTTLKRPCVVVESTSYYHEKTVRACIAAGIPCRLLNPLLTKQMIRATPRGKKTDKTDAVLIARLGAQGEGYLVETVSQNAKPVLRTGAQLRILASSMLLIQHHLEASLTGQAHLLEVLTTCRDLVNSTATQFQKAGAASADPVTMQLLMSIPGVGENTAAVLLAEYGDITRFHSAKAVVAYAGLDPRIPSIRSCAQQNWQTHQERQSRNQTLTLSGSQCCQNSRFRICRLLSEETITGQGVSRSHYCHCPKAPLPDLCSMDSRDCL